MLARETLSVLKEENFTNSIGQELKPGDKVVAVTTGYGHSVSVFTGIFGGVYRDRHSGQITGTRVNEIPYNTNTKVYNENGKHEEMEYVKTPVTRKDSWGREYTYNEWTPTPTGRMFDWVPNTHYRVSKLQLNRLFKIDTQLNQVNI